MPLHKSGSWQKGLKFHGCRFYAMRLCYFAENNGDERTDEENIYEILEQAKVLEELMKEVELPLSKQQLSNLKIEDYHINKALCWADCISSVISRIDSALHHPEEYI